MIVIKTILHPTDFSERSDLAFRLACWMARDYGARVIVLHVAEPLPTVSDVGMLIPPPPVDLLSLREKLDHLKARGGKAQVETLLLQGTPADEILKVAENNKCDLILMGTHGRTGIGRLLMGSVAEQIVRKATCPVLTVKTRVGLPENRAPRKRL